MTGEDLKQLRINCGLTRRVLSERIAVHPDTIKYWERKNSDCARKRVPELILAEFGFASFDIDIALKTAHARQLFVTDMRTRTCGCHEVLENLDDCEGDRGTRRSRLVCGARTRAGGKCQAKAVKGRKRCRLHGGLSTGPRTAAGRERIAQAQRLRWAGKKPPALALGTKLDIFEQHG